MSCAHHATAADFARWEAKARSMTDYELWWSARDARQAAERMRGWNPVAEGRYEDEAHTYGDELRRRRQARSVTVCEVAMQGIAQAQPPCFNSYTRGERQPPDGATHAPTRGSSPAPTRPQQSGGTRRHPRADQPPAVRGHQPHPTATPPMSDFFPTPTTLDEAVLAAEYSQQNVEYCGITCTPSGYFYCHGKRIGLAKAEAIVAQAVAEEAAVAEGMTAATAEQRATQTISEAAADHRVDPAAGCRTAAPQTGLDTPEPRQPKRTGFTWDALNDATKALFYRVGLVIEQQGEGRGAMLGTVLHIPLTEAPRLTNLKKAGLLATIEGTRKSHRVLVLTDAGKAQMAAGR